MSKNLIGTFKPFSSNAGVVIVKDTQEEIFIGARFIGNTLPGDMVECRIFTFQPEGKKRREGRINHVVARTKDSLIGLLRKDRTRWTVLLLNTQKEVRIMAFVPIKYENTYTSGDVVKFTIRPNSPRLEAIISEKIGRESDPRMKERIILESRWAPKEFGEKVKEEAHAVLSLPIGSHRKDFRNEMIVTIDGDDAKDFDDAITIKKKENGFYELQVHIADVAHYVKENSALDIEAKFRGNSIYIPGKVIPMLPFELSDNLCSLLPNQDRPVLSAIITFNGSGDITNCVLHEGLIHSKYRLTYNQVNTFWQNCICKKGEAEGVFSDPSLQEMLRDAYQLRDIIRKNRIKKGKIEFHFPETKIELDDLGNVVNVYRDFKNDAYNLIEEFMVSANEAVSTIFAKKKIPFLYRTHLEPSDESIGRMHTFLSTYDIPFSLSDNGLVPKQIADLLRSISGEPYEMVVSRFLLQSMSRAEYEDEARGHFGLALNYYSHFTSPIRRYPDLQIHRIIKDFIHGKLTQKQKEHYSSILASVAAHTTKTERTAEEIESEVKQMHVTQFLKKQIGKEYDAIVTGVQVFGVFFDLENGIDGFLHITDLPETLEYNETKIELRGNETRWHIGKKLRVRVEGTHPVNGRVQFSLLAHY